jgi:hypothetical protein
MARPAAATAIEVAGVMEEEWEEDEEVKVVVNARRVVWCAVDVKNVKDGLRFWLVNRAAACLPCAARRSACRDAAMMAMLHLK